VDWGPPCIHSSSDESDTHETMGVKQVTLPEWLVFITHAANPIAVQFNSSFPFRLTIDFDRKNKVEVLFYDDLTNH
jgi:hypothetical protein